MPLFPTPCFLPVISIYFTGTLKGLGSSFMSRSPTPKVSQTLVVACVEEYWLQLRQQLMLKLSISGDNKDQQHIILL